MTGLVTTREQHAVAQLNDAITDLDRRTHKIIGADVDWSLKAELLASAWTAFEIRYWRIVADARERCRFCRGARTVEVIEHGLRVDRPCPSCHGSGLYRPTNRTETP